MILCGYYVETTDLGVINEIIDKMKDVVIYESTQKVKKLITREITHLIDDCTRGYQSRPDNISLYDFAKGVILRNMEFARSTGAATEYNFNVSCNIFIYNDRTYIKFDAPNNMYLEGLRKIEGLIPYHVFDNNNNDLKKDSGKSHEDVWNNIREDYSNKPMFFVRLIIDFNDLFNFEYKDLKFEDINTRAYELARHEITARLINMYSLNQTAPTYKILEFFDQAIELLDTPIWKTELNNLISDYINKLVDITEELVMSVV